MPKLEGLPLERDAENCYGKVKYAIPPRKSRNASLTFPRQKGIFLRISVWKGQLLPIEAFLLSPGWEHYIFREVNMAGIPNMGGMMKQIQKMQEKIAQVQASLEAKTVQGEAGGGMVKATVNGKQQVVKIQIEKEVVNPEDIEMLEDLIIAAVNKGLEEAAKMAQDEMSKATNGMLPNIPGLNFPGL